MITTTISTRSTEDRMPCTLHLLKNMTIGDDKYSLLPGFNIKYIQYSEGHFFDITCTPVQYDKTSLIRSYLSPYAGKQVTVCCFENNSLAWKAKIYVADNARSASGSGQWFEIKKGTFDRVNISFSINTEEDGT